MIEALLASLKRHGAGGWQLSRLLLSLALSLFSVFYWRTVRLT
ncbi:hypothetical protein [Citrobacter amalonaticus]|nr:hypothetical protein [Citrobacter amalonaticus]